MQIICKSRFFFVPLQRFGAPDSNRLTHPVEHVLDHLRTVVGPLSDLYRIPVHLIYTMYIFRDFEQICFSPAPEHAKLNDS